DRRQLVSAVYNLLENAVKYSPAGSLIEVRGRATVSDEGADGRPEVEISVRDEGIGIPARDHERIFERFYRVDSTRSVTAGGTGLGLSIVRNVVTNHQGSVRVDSEESQGSTFTLRLPAANAGAHFRPAVSRPALSSRSLSRGADTVRVGARPPTGSVAPESHVDESEAPEWEVDDWPSPESLAPESRAPDSRAPDSRAPESESDDSQDDDPWPAGRPKPGQSKGGQPKGGQPKGGQPKGRQPKFGRSKPAKAG
ncbi:MAG TPA: ATP-binding protein, partial [Acidimicrobiales bacterium]|nr:ATP-binding protein [Acidimicrobiales bacterium]